MVCRSTLDLNAVLANHISAWSDRFWEANIAAGHAAVEMG
jgi:hypothetical protein